MDYLPVFLDIKQRRCIVVGGGGLALRKTQLLLRAGAIIKLIAPQVSDELKNLVEENAGTVLLKAFNEQDLDNAVLIIAATDNSEVNQLVWQSAKTKNIPVNVVDNPQLCTFIMPAIVDRDPVIVAISSGGSSPVLARQIKESLEASLPQNLGRFAVFLASYRDKAKQFISSFPDRLRFWEEVVGSDIREDIYSGREAQANRKIQAILDNSTNRSDSIGEVYLVGAGPGDPDLLTLRALRLMNQADVVLYDRLVSAPILQKVRADAEKIHVGKAQSNHTMEQGDINSLLISLAKQGKRVLRLKGGDPFIFGRGGEELESLAQHNIPFQVVPGVTAASGCASYAGIPLTHRDYSQSVRFLTGHFKDKESHLDWPSLVQENQTLVFYMGLMGLESICKQLIHHGLAAQHPIAIVQQGTLDTQKVLTGTLDTMPAMVKSNKIKAPTIIIIGHVVSLRDKLNWFNPHSS